MEVKNIFSVSVVQTNLNWENIELNLLKFDSLLEKINNKTDIVILPEMFTTGFSMNAEKFAEEENGRTLNWLMEKAGNLNALIIGSIIIRENSGYFNRLYTVFPDGSYKTYDKKHLFRIEGEADVYTPGNKRLIINYKGWKISPFICYDLRFPVWSRNKNNYDLYINVANWPGSRRDIWINLLKARAIENQVYAIGVNRIGEDSNDTGHTGDSMIIDPKGKTLAQAEKNKEEIINTEISLSELNDFRKKFPVGLDADNFEIIN
ncbi:amidohydrolase [Bacteroidota bacterium]